MIGFMIVGSLLAGWAAKFFQPVRFLSLMLSLNLVSIGSMVGIDLWLGELKVACADNADRCRADHWDVDRCDVCLVDDMHRSPIGSYSVHVVHGLHKRLRGLVDHGVGTTAGSNRIPVCNRHSMWHFGGRTCDPVDDSIDTRQ